MPPKVVSSWVTAIIDELTIALLLILSVVWLLDPDCPTIPPTVLPLIVEPATTLPAILPLPYAYPTMPPTEFPDI